MISQVPLRQLQAALRAIFQRWGRPKALRVDNGRPFGDMGNDIAPVLALWLIGIGVDVHWNRPRQPTDNAKVERMQGVTGAWAEPQQCADGPQLQRQLEAFAELQRGHYRCDRLQQHTRSEHYPALCAAPERAGAPLVFDRQRVLAFLARGRWTRKVSSNGQIEFFHRRWFVGRAHRRQWVHLQLEVATEQWVVTTDCGDAITRFSAEFLSSEAIEGLTLCHGTETKSAEAMLNTT